MGKFGQNVNEFGTETNLNMLNPSNMLNPRVLFTLSKLEIPSLEKFDLKNQNCLYRLKSGTKSNLNMQNSMLMLAFSVLHQKHRFSENLVKVVCLR